MDKKHITYTIKLLSIKDYFEKELFIKVAKKFDEKSAKDAINIAKNYGYIDDERVAKNYIRSRLISGYGPYYICHKLYEKGYNTTVDYIENIAVKENINMEKYILKIVATYKNKKSDDYYKLYSKCMNYLINSRGYSIDLCKKLIDVGDFEK